jgi:putative endonuclease
MVFPEKSPCVYTLAIRRNGTLYTDVTSDACYYQTHHTMMDAIRREKRIKEWRRHWEIRLIESMNPERIDLIDERTGEILDGPADVARRTI